MTHYGLSHITHPDGAGYPSRRPFYAKRFTWFCIAAIACGIILAVVL